MDASLVSLGPHRLFLEFMLRRPAAIEEDAKAEALKFVIQSDYKFLHRIIERPKEISTEEMNDLIKVINGRLKKVEMEIKIGICEVKELKMYVLVNTVENPITKYAINYNKTELEIFQKLLAQITVSEGGVLPYDSIFDVDFIFTREVSKEEIAIMVDELSGDGWFANEDGNIYLGIRSVLEMGPFLKSNYKVYDCFVCKQSVFKSKICENCSTYYHFYCLRRLFAESLDGPCPNCNVNCEIPALLNVNVTV